VTPANVHDYVALLSEHYLCGGVRKELASLLSGFWDVVPLEALQATGVEHTDLGLLLSGVQSISVDDWKQHANVAAAEGTHPELVRWFWEVMDECDDEGRARVLQFTTGMGRLPGGGFAELRPPFELKVKVSTSVHHLPSAHTCFNSLELPPYVSREQLDDKLLLAVLDGAGSFGLI